MEIAKFKIPRAGTLKSIMLFMEGNPSFDLPKPTEVGEADCLILTLQPALRPEAEERVEERKEEEGKGEGDLSPETPGGD